VDVDACVPDLKVCESTSEGEPELVLAIPSNGKAREKLVVEIRSDTSIEHFRCLAEQGYSCSDGLIL